MPSTSCTARIRPPSVFSSTCLRAPFPKLRDSGDYIAMSSHLYLRVRSVVVGHGKIAVGLVPLLVRLAELHIIGAPDDIVQPDTMLPLQLETLEVLPLRGRHLHVRHFDAFVELVQRNVNSDGLRLLRTELVEGYRLLVLKTFYR